MQSHVKNPRSGDKFQLWLRTLAFLLAVATVPFASIAASADDTTSGASGGTGNPSALTREAPQMAPQEEVPQMAPQSEPIQ